MQKYNLLSVVRRKRFHYCSQYLHRYPNSLNREFSADRPNQKWVTDISYIKTGQGFLYLSIIRNLYDNSIVAYKTDKEQSIKLVLDTIREAKKKEKITAELQLHSDQGFQYTFEPYYRLIKEYGISPSMSRRGNPYDNALAENFFSIQKTECIHRVKLATYEEVSLLIGEYINYYNNYRIQTKTKLTPLEKTKSVCCLILIFTSSRFFVLSAQSGAVQKVQFRIYYFIYNISYILTASSFRACSVTARTLYAFTLAPRVILISSPTFTSYDALATLPFTSTLPASQASLATVRRLIILETFKYLSNLIYITKTNK